MTNRKKWLIRGAVGIVVLAAVGFTFLKSIGMFASDPIHTRGGLAIGGYDPVAYFTEQKPVLGKPDISERWEGSTWTFASEENRQLFVKSPRSYAPQFGGYCAFAVSQNYTAKTDPNAWTIVDGRLYLNFDLDTQKQWLAQRDPLIAKADKNWPDVLW